MNYDGQLEDKLRHDVQVHLSALVDVHGLFRVMGALSDECRHRQYEAARTGAQNTVWQRAGNGIEVTIGSMTND